MIGAGSARPEVSISTRWNCGTLAHHAPAEQVAQRGDEIAQHGAAQAPAIEHGDLIGDPAHQQMIHRRLAEFVDQHRAILQPRRGQEMIEQRGLAAAQKARQQGNRQRIPEYHRSFIELLGCDEYGGDLAETVGLRLAVKTGAMPGMTGDALLLDLQQQRVAVAIDQEALQGLYLTGAFAFPPQALARARPVADAPGPQGLGLPRRRSSTPSSALRRCHGPGRWRAPARSRRI